MYAVVEIKGKQFKVTPGAEIAIPKTDAEIGSQLTYDRVLYLHDGDKPVVGTPTVDGVTVDATVLDHGKQKKVIVFRKKRRKGFRRTRGHRQQFTSIRIDEVNTGGKTKKAASKKSTKEQAAEEKPAETVEKSIEE